MKKLIAIATAVCIFGLGSASQAFARSTAAEAIIVKGDVLAKLPEESNAQPLQKGSTVEVGSTITTGDSSGLLMSAFPGSAIRVLESNEIILKEADLEKRGETVLGRKAVLDLRRGAVQVALEKREDGPVDFTVTTPQCVAAARGTVFETSSDGDATTTIVLEGSVALPSRWKGEVSDGKEILDGKEMLDGKELVFAVGPGQKGIVRFTPSGPEWEGPFAATAGELARLREFVEIAAAEGLIVPPVGEKLPPIGSLNLVPQVLPPIITQDEPLSN